MSDIIDISVPLGDRVPTWPGSEGYSRQEVLSHENGDGVSVSVVRMDVHTGTHVDAPRHFLPTGATVGALPLSELIGPAWVADVEGRKEITPAALEVLGIPTDCKRLLVKSTNSRLWDTGTFHEDYAALTPDAADYLVQRGITLVGIDYLSIQRFDDGPEAHQVLLTAEVIILEGINLASVPSGGYELLCLPLSIPAAEGSPARAVLRPLAAWKDGLDPGSSRGGQN